MVKKEWGDDSSILFMNELIDTYNKGVLEDEEIILELYFNDLDETYQIYMSSNECILKTKDFLNYNSRLEVPFKEFSSIIKGTIDRDKLVLKKKNYTVLGEFRPIARLVNLFGLYTEVDPADASMVGMVSTYNIGVLEDEKIIFELYFEDMDRTYQLHMYPNDCILRTNNFIKYTLRIETTFKTWVDIANGEIDTGDALVLRRFKFLGDKKAMFKFLDLYDVLNEK